MLLAITVVLGYFAVTNVKVDNRYGTMLPKDSEPKKDYELLKKTFGGNESLLIFAIDNENLYNLENFKAWYDFGIEVDAFDAVDSVFSEAHMYEIQKNTDLEIFEFEKIAQNSPNTQEEVDSLRAQIRKNPFYKGILYNKEDNSSLMMAFISEEIMADMKTANVLIDVEATKGKYEEILGEIRVSGMPHIRVMVGQKLQAELLLFIALSIGVTSLLLFIFFRSLKIVLICNVVVFFGVIWSLGSIGAFDFQLSILMVLIPPLIIVISIPNCIFLINRFHKEIIDHGNMALALSRVIQKIGNATFLTNLTTALGFSTFMFTNSERLSEFGIIASINILCVFLLSITILPIIWSYSSVPKSKHLKHLQKKWLHIAVEKLEYLTLYRRKAIYIGTFIVLVFAIWGTSKVVATGNITGDLPQNDPITTDLNYIQDKFGGSIPFDIMIDTKKKGTFYTRLDEIDSLQTVLAEFSVFSKSLSVADAVKILNMSYSNNNPDKFEIPSINKLQRIFPYVENSANTTGTNGFLDSTQTLTRVSLQIRDIGSYEIQDLVDSIRPIAYDIINPKAAEWDSAYSLVQKGDKKKALTSLYAGSPEIKSEVEKMMAGNNTSLADDFMMEESLIFSYHDKAGFNDTLKKAIELNKWDLKYSGVSYVAANGTQYLVTNLFVSLGIAIIVIGILMSFLFRSWRMVLVSLIPNFIPLLFTAGTMGFLGIPIKPSTLLVFSIAFGISVDDTIHFLAKFRQELKSHEHDLRRCILVALRETGTSMIYTSIVLFFGFMVFAFSQFGGTKALGILVSLTLAVAMFTNLLILPTLLLWMDKKISNKAIAEPLFQLYDEEEDIELEDLEIEQTLEKYKEEDAKNHTHEQ
ncbi:MAG: efflux RND transporter permease subunit [Crocinitomicaceae bacterium]|nr:efflux RND transporter permease subunit [Crocinitomicaceae bacterium]